MISKLLSAVDKTAYETKRLFTGQGISGINVSGITPSLKDFPILPVQYLEGGGNPARVQSADRRR